MTEPASAPNPESGYQWRIVIDGDPGRRPPHTGCWIDVTDGDFQNLNVVGRLEFRAKPVDAAPQLWARIEAALDPDSPIPLRDAARSAGVRFSVLFRIRQGRMPGPADLAAIETWLAAHEETNPPKEDR